MSAPREAEVHRIVSGLQDKLEELVTTETDANEVVSAVFTITLHVMRAAVACGANIDAFRHPLELLYGAIPPPPHMN